MAVKRILVPLDSSAFSDGAAETACRVAKIHQAEVAGVAVLDSPEIRSSLVPAIGPYYPLMIEEVQAKVDHANKILSDCLDRFSGICNKAGVRHVETEYEGIPVQKLLESSIFFDLVVMGLETSFHFETRNGRGDTLDKMLDRTATPLLAVPPSGLETVEKVTIAFDGSFSASRALRDFISFGKPLDPEILVATANLPEGESDFLLRNVRALLNAHGYTDINTQAFDKPIDEAIRGKIIDSSDLVVAGIHSRSNLKAFFVGSFTLELIERGDTALFLSH